jgi:hypothetical protein
MKKSFFTLILFSVSFTLSSQNLYVESMKNGMELLQKAQTYEELFSAANHFERIAQVEKEKWHPAYHASFAYTIAAARVSDPKMIEEILDSAQKSLDQAATLDDKNSEILTLQGFIYMLRIGVDPVTRGQQYSGMSSASLQKAKAMDANNPRAAYLLAQLSFGTAQFFGSSSEEACRLNERALALFASEQTTKSNPSFDPLWGKDMAESFKMKCAN